MQACVKLPVLHCAFKDCNWAIPQTSGELYHWQLEWELYNHLKAKHDTEEMREVIEWVQQRIQTWHTQESERLEFLWVHSFYIAAVQEREREHMPLIGPTKDRQMLALVTKLANSDTIQSRMCFC